MKSLLSPLGKLIALSAAACIQQAVRGYSGGADQPDLGELVWWLGMPLLIVCWLRADCKRGGYWPCFEYDWFVLIAWPVALPHYLVHTRGIRGMLVFLAFIGLYYVPFLFLGLGYVIGYMSRGGRVVWP